MKKHLKYLSYVLRHKWFVFVECARHGLLWRGIVHDMSKFRPSEWFPYVEAFNGRYGYAHQSTTDAVAILRHRKVMDEFEKAWLLHQHRNPHHWQHWILVQDDDGDKALKMPLDYVMEMVCDWRGAGKAQGHGDDLFDWFESHKENMVLHCSTRENVEGMVYGPRVERA